MEDGANSHAEVGEPVKQSIQAHHWIPPVFPPLSPFRAAAQKQSPKTRIEVSHWDSYLFSTRNRLPPTPNGRGFSIRLELLIASRYRYVPGICQPDRSTHIHWSLILRAGSVTASRDYPRLQDVQEVPGSCRQIEYFVCGTHGCARA